MLFDSLDDLPAFVKRLGKAQQKKWMTIWNDTFRDTASETEAHKRANGAVMTMSVRWSDLRSAADTSKRFPVCEWMVSDVFPDWEPSGVYEVQLMRTGLWRDHPEYGDILITKDDLAEAVRNFRGSSRKPFLDEEHGITHPEWSSRPGEAFGFMADMWIEDLDNARVEPAEAVKSEEKVLVLRGRYEVNEEANAWLQKKSKAFFSPTFHPVYYNKETGETQGMTVIGGAMTNVPFFDGMDVWLAVASGHWTAAKKFVEMYPRAQFKVSRPDGMTNEDAISRLDKMGLEVTSMEYWELWVRAKEGGDLAGKMGELEKAGFTVTCFYQGVQQYGGGDADGVVGHSVTIKAGDIPNSTTTPVRRWHLDPFYSR